MRLTLDPSELTRCRMSTIIPKQISRPPAYNWIQRSRGSNKFCTIPGSASADRLQESHHHTCTAQTSKFGSSISLYLYTLTWCMTSPQIMHPCSSAFNDYIRFCPSADPFNYTFHLLVYPCGFIAISEIYCTVRRRSAEAEPGMVAKFVCCLRSLLSNYMRTALTFTFLSMVD